MARQLAKDNVTGPLGTFRVSTIQTVMGGGGNNTSSFSPFFSEADYAEDEGWPFETMIFAEKSSIGLYHAPYATEAEARTGHQQMVETIKAGLEFGGGVEGPFGTPSLTRDEWMARQVERRGAS